MIKYKKSIQVKSGFWGIRSHQVSTRDFSSAFRGHGAALKK